MSGDVGEIKKTVADFINDKFLLGAGLSGLGEKESLLEKGILDSTGVLELVGFLDEKFGIITEDEEIIPENLDSMGSIAEFVIRKKE